MRRERIHPAKITRPVISRAYPRKRLFRLLDEGQKGKAIWVNGPPGSGKTTLVSSYIESHNIPSIWLQVDSGDRYPATFFHYLALAVKGLTPGRRSSLPPQEMKTVGQNELRLSDEEFTGIAKALGYKIGNREKVAHLQKAIQGWTAGLILMIERFRAGISDKECLLSGITDHRVFDYFMSEIFEKTNPETRNFLMKTSFFPQMTGEMAIDLTGNQESHQILQKLDSQRFFIDSRSHNEIVYQYHPLFKEFLQSCAEGKLSRQELKEVQKRGAHILKSAGYTEDAAGLFIKAKDWNGLSNLVMEHAASLISQGRFQVLGSWITSIPSHVLNSSPWLLYYLGQCRIPQNPALARKDLEAAYRLFKEGGFDDKSTGLFLSWSAIVDTFLYEWKDFEPLDFWIEEFERLTAEFPDFPSVAVEEHAISSIFGALMFRQPQNPRIHYWEERAMAIIQDSPDVTRRFSIGHNLIFYYCWMGNMDIADFVVKILLPVFKRCGAISLSYLLFLRAYALYHCYIASPGTAQSLAEEGLRLGEKAGIRLLDNMFLMVGIYSS
ncbi:MAG: hypothetical protein HZB32_05020 [Nitrospirae bacterium]|nr:hypothetical protein [Nitrospirota bacterium]